MGTGLSPAQMPPPTGGAPTPAGPTGPATTTPQPSGMEMQASMYIDAAMNMIKKAIGVLDPKSPMAQSALKAMTLLTKDFGKPSPDLSRASMKLVSESMPGINPTNPAAFADMQRQQSQNALGRPAPALAPQTPVQAGA